VFVTFDVPSADAAAIAIVGAYLKWLPEKSVFEGYEGVKFAVVRRTNRC
jgi:hypothetical protein